jgi:hypothetical protein
MHIIAITVSTNYSDLLYHALKSNHKYFKYWIFVTNQNDKETIELLNQYDNITILFFDFQEGGRAFNKGGAVKKAQEFAYQNFPHEWYLNIDSDICLEKNFGEEMEKIYDSLKEDHIYGSENRFHYGCINDYTNRENSSSYPCGKMIQGFFQLYKQKILYDDSYDCSWCDVKFSRDFLYKQNFLDNIICNHLGHSAVNWQGRKNKTDFIQ